MPCESVIALDMIRKLADSVAMIGGTALGRAMISFFLGLTKPLMPIRLFKDYESAVVWARQMNRERGAPVES